MRKTVKSLRYALAGVIHSLLTERNFPMFLACYTLILILAFYLGVTRMEWVALIITGGTFLSVELINTSIERLANSLNEERQKLSENIDTGIKLTKDVAAGASFMGLLTVIAVSLIIFVPHFLPWLRQ